MGNALWEYFGMARHIMLLAYRRCPPFAAALRPAGTRALAFKATHKRQPKKEESSGGRDPYATLKAAIIAEPDPELSTAIMAEKETAAARRERRAEYSRQAITEVRRAEALARPLAR